MGRRRQWTRQLDPGPRGDEEQLHFQGQMISPSNSWKVVENPVDEYPHPHDEDSIGNDFRVVGTLHPNNAGPVPYYPSVCKQHLTTITRQNPPAWFVPLQSFLARRHNSTTSSAGTPAGKTVATTRASSSRCSGSYTEQLRDEEDGINYRNHGEQEDEFDCDVQEIGSFPFRWRIPRWIDGRGGRPSSVSPLSVDHGFFDRPSSTIPPALRDTTKSPLLQEEPSFFDKRHFDGALPVQEEEPRLDGHSLFQTNASSIHSGSFLVDLNPPVLGGQSKSEPNSPSRTHPRQRTFSVNREEDATERTWRKIRKDLTNEDVASVVRSIQNMPDCDFEDLVRSLEQRQRALAEKKLQQATAGRASPFPTQKIDELQPIQQQLKTSLPKSRERRVWRRSQSGVNLNKAKKPPAGNVSSKMKDLFSKMTKTQDKENMYGSKSEEIHTPDRTIGNILPVPSPLVDHQQDHNHAKDPSKDPFVFDVWGIGDHSRSLYEQVVMAHQRSPLMPPAVQRIPMPAECTNESWLNPTVSCTHEGTGVTGEAYKDTTVQWVGTVCEKSDQNQSSPKKAPEGSFQTSILVCHQPRPEDTSLLADQVVELKEGTKVTCEQKLDKETNPNAIHQEKGKEVLANQSKPNSFFPSNAFQNAVFRNPEMMKNCSSWMQPSCPTTSINEMYHDAVQSLYLLGGRNISTSAETTQVFECVECNTSGAPCLPKDGDDSDIILSAESSFGSLQSSFLMNKHDSGGRKSKRVPSALSDPDVDSIFEQDDSRIIHPVETITFERRDSDDSGIDDISDDS